MSSPQTPVGVDSVNVASASTGFESGQTTAASRMTMDDVADEDDQTYVLSDSNSSDISEDDSLSESGFESGSDSDLSPDNLRKLVALVDDTSIALRETGKEDVSQVGQQQNNSLSSFLLRHEVPRKAFHSSIGLVTIYLYTCGFSQHQIAVPLWAIFTGTFLFELARLNLPTVNRAVLPWVRYLIRDSERSSWNGIVFYLAGVSLVLTFAAKDVAVVSILLLSWADTAASTVGRAWGKYTPKVAGNKSLAGSTASFLTGVFVCYLYYGYLVQAYPVNESGANSYTETSSRLSFRLYALATGLIASVSEALNLAGLDDNFTIPVLSSLFLTGLISASRS